MIFTIKNFFYDFKEDDVKLSTIPQDFIEETLGIPEVLARRDILDKFDVHLLTAYQKNSISVDGDTLILSPQVLHNQK